MDTEMLTVEVDRPMQVLEAVAVGVVCRRQAAPGLAVGVAPAQVLAKRATDHITVTGEFLALEVMEVAVVADKLQALALLARGPVVALGQVIVVQAMVGVHMQMLTLMLVVEGREVVKIMGAEVAREVEMVTLMLTPKVSASCTSREGAHCPFSSLFSSHVVFCLRFISP